jgi:hypothetical protein
MAKDDANAFSVLVFQTSEPGYDRLAGWTLKVGVFDQRHQCVVRATDPVIGPNVEPGLGVGGWLRRSGRR